MAGCDCDRGTPPGQTVRVQRSANLVDWEDWVTLKLHDSGCEPLDDTAAPRRFYRLIE